MNEEKILEDLKFNIPVDYVRSCDTSNGIGYYEEDTESWQYQLYNYITNLQKQNTELKEKINTYENPEDLTLMFMYCTEKAKDKIKELKEENFKLQARSDRFINYWNKLKEWLEDEYKRCDEMGNPAVGYAMGQINRTKNKMQEIEKGGMNE